MSESSRRTSMAVEKIERGEGNGEGYRIHWSVILAGAFTALGIWAFLYALGAAIGGAGNNANPTAWTAIYLVCSPVIALFFGGLVAARSHDVVDKGSGLLHGVAIWGFAMIIGLLLLGTIGAAMISSAAGGATMTNYPAGYSWAVAGAILGSLITALIGAMTVSSRRAETTTGERKRFVGTPTHREVYP